MFCRTLVLTALLACLMLGGRAAAQTAQPLTWASYRNGAFQYQVDYPSLWQVVEAKPRTDNKAAWAGDVLLEGELQKVTFLERPHGIWQGEFQVRVLANPDQWDLKRWVERDELKDITGGSLIEEVRDTTLDGKPAKRLGIFMFDHQGIEIIALHKGRVFILSFAGGNPNDPEIKSHQEIYRRMVSAFKFLD